MRRIIFITFILLVSFASFSVEADGHAGFTGVWVINDELSDDTDKQVEKAIKAAGGKIKRGGKKGKGRYKGGPPEQAIYDHMSYDDILQFQYHDPEFRLVYAEDFERMFYSDNRGRTVTASGSGRNDRVDYSFAAWDGAKLLVESRPRDGGWISEIYSLDPETGQLRVELKLKPLSFRIPINIVRIYDHSTKIN